MHLHGLCCMHLPLSYIPPFYHGWDVSFQVGTCISKAARFISLKRHKPGSWFSTECNVSSLVIPLFLYFHLFLFIGELVFFQV